MAARSIASVDEQRALTPAEVAARAGVSEDDVARIRSLGILSAGEEGFGGGDVRRVLLAVACERAGLPMDAIAESIRDGRLSFAFLDAPTYQRWAERSSRTYAEVCDELGIEFAQLRKGLEAMGFASTEPGDHIREDELEILPLIALSLRSGLLDEAWLVRIGRGYADSLRRLTQAENEVYHSRFEVPFLEQGMTQAQAMERASAMAGEFNPLVDRAIIAMLRRQQELQWTEHLVEHIEDDLERSGRLGRPERLPAMAFVDLTGYTRLTEERGDEAAVQAASELAALVEREARDHGGTPVKWLGDGVMVSFHDPEGGVRSALHLVRAIPGAGLPPAHVGLAAGRVVAYSGDYFGRTVNMAARLSAHAAAGQVLVNDAVVDAVEADDVRFAEIGPIELKGFAEPVRAFEAMP
jgi:class 3 adenylate cyclase